MGNTNTKQYYCIIDPKTGFRHITTNVQAVMDAHTLGFEVWHNQKKMEM